MGRVLNGLDQAVRSPCRGSQTLTKPAYGLVVERVGSQPLRFNDLAQQRPFSYSDVVAWRVWISSVTVA